MHAVCSRWRMEMQQVTFCNEYENTVSIFSRCASASEAIIHICFVLSTRLRLLDEKNQIIFMGLLCRV